MKIAPVAIGWRNAFELPRIAADAYSEWVKQLIPHAVQVSFPRSGRRWLAALVCAITGLTQVGLERFNFYTDSNLCDDRYLYCTAHSVDIVSDATKYLLLVRNPMDTYISYLHLQYGIGKRDAWDDFDYLRVQARHWATFHKPVMALNPFIVKYEKLCLQPKIELGRIFEYIKVIGLRDIDTVIEEISTENDSYSSGNFAALNDVFRREQFKSGEDRYYQCCFKRKTDRLFTEKHYEIIYEATEDTAKSFGYFEEEENAVP